jgi:hypothetical protein
MRTSISICIALVLIPLLSVCQTKDSLRVMHYNLLQFGNYFSGCTTSNNNVVDKDGYLKTIIDEFLPDIFTVNEMRAINAYAKRIVQNSLNQNGRDYYEQAVFSNNTSSSICNMLFYNSNKIGLLSQDFIDKGINNTSLTRQIDVYHLYYKDPFLSTHKDTLKLTVLVCHLNAGIASERARETEAIANYLKTKELNANVILCGDLNIDASSSQAYQNLINNSDSEYSLLDPINSPGNWASNSSFKSIHTQSTRTSGGCAAGGGMDDRFDFILMSNDLRDDSSGVLYVNDSYEAAGQDGQRFNGSLISPINASYDSDVIQALYDMSDHLPVLLELAFDQRDLTAMADPDLDMSYFLKGNVLEIRNASPRTLVSFRDIQGRLLLEKQAEERNFRLGLPHHEGLILCSIESGEHEPVFMKIISKR